MNLNELNLLQPLRPNHVTNQILPSFLSKSNWLFPKALLCDTSVPRSLSLFLSLCFVRLGIVTVMAVSLFC